MFWKKTTESHVNTIGQEIELLIIASIETLKCLNSAVKMRFCAGQRTP